MIRDIEPLAGYPEPYDLLAALLQDGTKEWRGELDKELSADTMIWQPYAGMHSIGAIILHIINIEVWWLERFVLDLPVNQEERKLLMANETDVDEWRWPSPPHQPLSWYYELQDRIRARTLEGIKHWPEADVAKECDGRHLTMRWVIGHVIQHESYHGGQAVLLNRLKELKDAG
jgi:uncharacterized damage-inducible protein DinB